MAAADNIRAALARMEGGEKWCKTALGSNGERCIMLSVPCGDHASTSIRVIREVIGEQYPERTGELRELGVAKFNDHPDTTWEDVERVMEKAALHAEEQGL